MISSTIGYLFKEKRDRLPISKLLLFVIRLDTEATIAKSEAVTKRPVTKSRTKRYFDRRLEKRYNIENDL